MFDYDEFNDLTSGIAQGDYVKLYLKPSLNLSSDEKYLYFSQKIKEINWKYISKKIYLKPEFFTYKISLSEYGFNAGYETRYNDIEMISLLYGDIISEYQDLSIESNTKTTIENIIDFLSINNTWVEPPFGKIEGIDYPQYRNYYNSYFLTYDFYKAYSYVTDNSSSSSASSSSLSYDKIKKEINTYIYKYCGCPFSFITEFQILPVDFITENIFQLSMDYLCKFQLFENSFFSSNPNGILYHAGLEDETLFPWNFDLIIQFQRFDLSDQTFIENFLKPNLSNINWDGFCKFQNVPVGFSDSISFVDTETLTQKIGFNTDDKLVAYAEINPYFKSIETKVLEISNVFNIENQEDDNDLKYFYAYKSVDTKRNTENLRPRESFVFGQSYDCSLKRTFERYSDRYTVGTKESFFEHYNDNKFIKVKVLVKDVFIINENGRLFVNKFEVVEDEESSSSSESSSSL